MRTFTPFPIWQKCDRGFLVRAKCWFKKSMGWSLKSTRISAFWGGLSLYPDYSANKSEVGRTTLQAPAGCSSRSSTRVGLQGAPSSCCSQGSSKEMVLGSPAKVTAGRVGSVQRAHSYVWNEQEYFSQERIRESHKHGESVELAPTKTKFKRCA